MSIAIERTAMMHDSPEAVKLKKRGDTLFFTGCLICGSWVFGLIGAPILIYGLYLLRKAQLRGAAIRPWSITIIGGLILVDASVNYLAWGLDLLPAHYSMLIRSLWINYGMFGDGGYALYYNLPEQLHYNTAAIGGVSVPIEKSIQIACIILVMPIRIAGAWGLLQMKRWGLQWSILGNWMYLTLWIIYAAAMTYQFDLRFGTSEFGVLGFWLIGGLPFLGPLVLLPYLHTVNRELWSE